MKRTARAAKSTTSVSFFPGLPPQFAWLNRRALFFSATPTLRTTTTLRAAHTSWLTYYSGISTAFRLFSLGCPPTGPRESTISEPRTPTIFAFSLKLCWKPPSRFSRTTQ
jgi:hypothetical protein